MMARREAVFAGRFYPGEPDRCAAMVDELLSGLPQWSGIAAIVPHAGWIYSGRTAARGIMGIDGSAPQSVVMFGAVHVPTWHAANVFPAGVWDTPLGPVEIDEELAERLARQAHLAADPAAHRNEHSIEVELPLVRRVLPTAKIVPIMVRPGPDADEIGRTCAREAITLGRSVAFVGSTDLTHYGPAFDFEPHGRGAPGLRWAKEVNDRRMIGLLQALDCRRVVPEAAVNRNACGAGAIAATIAAALATGADRYQELEHTTSADVEGAAALRSGNAVGYEAGVFLRPAAPAPAGDH
jgi:AmmeMemoRadiSam system protein B